MKANDFVLGLIVLLFGGAVALYAQTFPILAGMTVGPGLFPTLIGMAMAVCGAVLIGKSVLAARQGVRVPAIVLEDWAKSPVGLARGAAVLLALLFYLLAVRWLGFHITATLIVGGLMLALGVRIIVAVPVAILSALVIHYAFYSLLRVPLPWGLLLPFAW